MQSLDVEVCVVHDGFHTIEMEVVGSSEGRIQQDVAVRDDVIRLYHWETTCRVVYCSYMLCALTNGHWVHKAM